VPEVPGFFLQRVRCHAHGQVESDLILRDDTDLIDVSVLNLARFAQCRMIHETAVL
jgi:hypothetical protein